MPSRSSSSRSSLRVAGLFAGIGGIEHGLHLAGHRTSFLCEVDESAAAVLKHRFGLNVHRDIRDLAELPDVDLVASGFPCQDLSSVGRTRGISGSRSALVEHVFRLVERSKPQPEWLLFENVPFMLRLGRGAAMTYLVARLERLGYRWAYRVVDTRAFGLPQRRLRVVLLASCSDDPGAVLFADKAQVREDPEPYGVACGFYWTEGNTGVGWAVNAVPTLKGGSALGIVSPPAIRMSAGGGIGTPHIRDAERLQGFDSDWTVVAESVAGATRGARWKLVGNAVSVPVAEWVGRRLLDRGNPRKRGAQLSADAPWPLAAEGDASGAWCVDMGTWPVRRRYRSLERFLEYPVAPLSVRAASGFLGRLERSSLHVEPWFLDELREHVAGCEALAA